MPNTQSTQPKPVQIAHALLDQMESGGDDLMRDINAEKKNLRAVLPSFAMRLHKKGETITEALLKKHIAENTLNLTHTAQNHTYDDIKKQLPLSQEQLQTKLRNAIEKCDLDAVKKLHAQGADLSFRNNYPVKYILRILYKDNATDILEYMLKNGANLEEDKQYALDEVLHKQNGQLLTCLLKYCPSFDINDTQISTALIRNGNGNRKLLDIALSHGAEFSDPRYLVAALQKGQKSIIDILDKQCSNHIAAIEQYLEDDNTHFSGDALRYIYNKNIDLNPHYNRIWDSILNPRKGQIQKQILEHYSRGYYDHGPSTAEQFALYEEYRDHVDAYMDGDRFATEETETSTALSPESRQLIYSISDYYRQFALLWEIGAPFPDTITAGMEIFIDTMFKGAMIRHDLGTIKRAHAAGIDLARKSNAPMRHLLSDIRNLNDVSIIKYLHENGAPLDENTLNKLDLEGVLKINNHEPLSYLLQNGLSCAKIMEYLQSRPALTPCVTALRALHDNGGDIPAIARHITDNLHNRDGIKKKQAAALLYMQEIGISLDADATTFLYNYKKWQYLLGDQADLLNSSGIVHLNPDLIRKDTLTSIYEMYEKEDYSGSRAMLYAYHTGALFQTPARVLDYLSKWGTAGKQPLHDICHEIQIPETGNPDLKAWGDATLKQGPEMTKLVKFAHKLSRPLKSRDGKSWSLTLTQQKTAKFHYANGADHLELARMAKAAKWNERNFNAALKLTQKYTKKYGEDGQKPNRIPVLRIDGKAFDMSDYECIKLPDGDLRGLFLGTYTSCCQHMGGAGKEYAAHGYLDKDGGFYVVQNKETKQIVAQTWAWRGAKDEIVFDSLENLMGKFNTAAWKPICENIAAEFEKRSDITAFTIGTGGNTPGNIGYSRAKKPVKPRIKSADAYCDSRQQYLVWQRQTADPKP